MQRDPLSARLRLVGRRSQMQRFTLVFFIGIGLAEGATAQDSARRASLDARQASLSVCVAYYSIDLKCSAEKSVSAKLARVVERSHEAASVLGMSAADVALRSELDIIIQMSLIQEDCANVATLRSRYDVECDPLAVR
jgi:hypothetical protein